MSSPTLTVFKASAGSGKTFTLAVEYIKLLISNPYAYEGILAVTFTNKATEEMKMRILSQLYGLWKQLPDSQSYMNELKKALGKDETFISQQSEKALRLLLHNYQFFRVQTIDTFFQAVLRNLAKELQLSANLRVGLNNKQVVEQAVDNLIDSLASDKNLLHVVTKYMEDSLAEDRQWNVIGPIKKFGGTIFQEFYKRNRKKMDAVFQNPNFFDDYSQELRKIMSDLSQKYIKTGKDVLKEVANKGLTVKDFSYGESGPIGYFVKLSKGQFSDDKVDFMSKRLSEAIDNTSKWATKTSKRLNDIISFAESYLVPKVEEIEKDRENDYVRYNSARLTLRHLNDVRLLRRIEESAHELNDAAQRFMLSDTQSLLNEMIGDDDAPFIFEKIGSHLEHIMIDEFQDTSTVQWANFKTLLKDCMSQGKTNLIVGDVKQSIYRFRSGDWRLLNDIDKEFAPSELDFQPKTTNWRSQRNVINFNNAFFTKAAKIEVANVGQYSKEAALQLEKAYSDVCQDIPANKKQCGLVHIEMLPKELKDEMNERTLQIILDLQENKGIAAKDIAILVRNKKEITELAKYIEENSNVRVVSAEAFCLNASKAVQTIVDAMTVLSRPQDVLTEAVLRRNSSEQAVDILINRRSELQAMTLHDMAEEIVRIFQLDGVTNEGAYVTAFFDCMHTFCNDMAPVLEDFLEAWESELAENTIETADCDGVRILTIHKSKGLEFNHVILPYCNWNGNSPGTTIWAEPSKEPFSKLPMVPLEYKTVTSLQRSIYEADGVNEYIQSVVDNLNLLYVAMTRAGHSLFIIGERGEKNLRRSKVIEEVISQFNGTDIEGLPLHIDGLDEQSQVLTLTYGSLDVCKASEEGEDEKNTSDEDENEDKVSNVFEPKVSSIQVNICSHKSNAEFRQSNESRRFADDATDEADRNRMCRKGSVMHQVFSTIRTTDDIEKALMRMEFDGTLYGEGVTHDGLVAEITQKFENEQVKEWFSPKWTLYNERSIITPDSEFRPDRVMTDGKETIVVDFKFGKPNRSYHEQVRNYVSLLKDMQMPDVKGYLWYVNENKIESV